MFHLENETFGNIVLRLPCNVYEVSGYLSIFATRRGAFPKCFCKYKEWISKTTLFR
jgi:hypothetical protein